MKLNNRASIFKLVLLVVMIAWPFVLRNDYATNVMVIAGIYAMLTVGFALLFGQAGQPSIGHAAFFGVGAYTTGLLTVRFGFPPLLALVAGGVAAGAVAFILGVPVLRLRGIMLVLVTMALGEIFYVVVREARAFTGGLSGLGGIPWLGIGGWALDDYIKQYYAVWAIVFLMVIFSERIVRARPGRAMRALSIDEVTATTLGIHTTRWKLNAFVLSAVYAGLGGGMYAFVMSAINPEDFVFMLSLMIVIITLVGGVMSQTGAAVGAIVMTWLVRSFSGYQEYSGSMYAVVLILLIMFLPGGLAGGLRADQKEWLRRLFRLGSGKAPAAQPTLVEDGAEKAVDVSPAPTVSEGLLGGAALIERAKARKEALALNGKPLLRVEGITVAFGGLLAVNNVSLEVREGTIHALIGPNGAGKTTLFNSINGVHRANSGRQWFAGQEITRSRPEQIAELGMGRSFQGLHVFPNMSVLENVMSGRHRHEKGSFISAGLALPWQQREEQASQEQAMQALALVGLEHRALWPVAGLPYGQQKLVEVARAVATEPRLLLLDEPAAGLNTTERIQLMERVTRIRDAGITVLLVEHDMEVVMGISDTVSVLDYGKMIAEGTPEEVQKHPAVIEAYLGVKHGHRESAAPRRDTSADRTEALLKVEGVSTYYGSICAVRDVSVDACPGEIVAVLGANGAGKTTLLRTISGVLKARSGHIIYRAHDLTHQAPAAISGAGIGHVPEGRHVFPTLSVQDNLRLGAYRRSDKAGMAEDYDFVFEMFPVLKDRRKQTAGTLSGGEQQMLAIGRALMGRPQLLLLDEPSMGLAPLVVEQIFETLVKLNERGLTLLMVEQNAEVALSVAHHVFVLQTGRVALHGPAELLRKDARVRALYLGQKEMAGEAS